MSRTGMMPRVGFIGLGLMGTPMSLALRRAGFPLIVYNRTAARCQPLVDAGAEIADSPADVARRTDVVFACLGSVAATEEVFLGPAGVVADARPGQIVVDHGTIGPSTARRIAAAAAARGAAFLDAPVSGGPAGAAEGALTIMVGGDRTAFATIEPVLRAMGRHVRHVGDVGAGCTVKLVNQALTAIHAASAAEAMVLGVKAGADPAVLLELLATSFGQSRMLDRSGPRFLARDFSAATQLQMLWKDLGLVRALGDAHAMELPLTAAAADLCRQALEAGLAEADIAALVVPIEGAAGVQVIGGR